MQMSQAKIIEANEGLKIPEEHCNSKIDYKKIAAITEGYSKISTRKH